MIKDELLKIIKDSGEGIVFLKDEYRFVLKPEQKTEDLKDKEYEYSKINSIVFDGVDGIRVGYSNFPCDSEDFYARYTNLRNMDIKLDDFSRLDFIE